VAFYPEPKIFGNRLVVVLTGAPYRVFRSTLQGLKSTGCRPLAMRSLMMEVDEYLYLINCIAQLILAIAC
jgi:hypothetical protein